MTPVLYQKKVRYIQISTQSFLETTFFELSAAFASFAFFASARLECRSIRADFSSFCNISISAADSESSSIKHSTLRFLSIRDIALPPVR